MLYLGDRELLPLRETSLDSSSVSELDALYEEDGYLFFRNALDPDLTRIAGRELISELKREGVVKEDGEGPTSTGASLDQIDEDRLYALSAYRRLLDAQSVSDFLEKVFRKRVFIFRSVNIRYALPHDDVHVSPPHQDRFFVGPNDDFRTAWIPLISIPDSVGGLALARGSHRGEVREHVPVGAESYVFKGRKQLGIPNTSIGYRWLSTRYEPGDVLIFHNRMIHAALPNRSDVVRLSLDVRVQPASTTPSWQALKTIPEMRSYRAAVRALVDAEGGTEEAYESILRQMMMDGSECSETVVRHLLVGTRSGHPASEPEAT